MNIATASSNFAKRFLQVVALFAVLGLSANATAQTFTVSPNSAGGTPVTINGILGQTIQRSFAITNNSNLPTTVFASVTSDANAGFALLGLGSVTIAANATGSLTLNFTPLTTTTQNATLRLVNGIDSALVALQGVVQRSFNISPNTSGSTSISFSAGVGASDTERFTITNNSNSSITVGSTLSGSGASAFSLSGSSTTVAANSTSTLRAVFNPSASGTYNSVLRLVNGIDTQLVNLTGATSLLADFTVTPISVGTLPVTLNTSVGQTVSQTFTVTNATAQQLTVSGSLSGSGSSAFSLDRSSVNVAANSSATFTLNFSSATSGTQDAVLRFSSTADTVLVNVRGIASAIAERITLTANRLFVEFNNVATGVQQCQDIVLTNTGSAALNLTNASFASVMGGQNEFTLGTDLSQDLMFEAGQSDTISVCFTPTRAGQSVFANLQLEYSGVGSDSTILSSIRLEGNAEAVVDSLNLNIVNELNFDALPGETECLTVNLSNVSATLGAVASLSLSDTNAGFSITSGNTVNLAVLGNSQVTICYTGDSLRPNTSTNLNVRMLGVGNVFLGDLNVTLNGTTDLDLNTGLDSLLNTCFLVRGGNIGSILLGGTTGQTITITNRTGQAATITSGAITSNGQTSTAFSFANGTNFPVTISAFGSTSFNVNFTPNDSLNLVSTAQANFAVDGNLCNDLTVNLIGTGLLRIDNVVPGLSLDTLAIIRVGGSSDVAVISGDCDAGAQTVSLQNNLSTALTITGLSFSGENSNNFMVSSTSPMLPATLQAGEILNVNVRFICGQVSGVYRANLNVQAQDFFLAASIPFQAFQLAPADVARAEESGVTVSVSPNPTRGIVRVEVKDASSARVEIMNVLGQTVATGEGTSFSWNGDTAGASAGIYIVRVTGTNAQGREFVETRQIVIE